ncbi:MAG: DMT family transporter, partial [Pseudomonadota bacterium]
MTASDNPRLGIGLRVLSGVLMAGMFVCVKVVSEGVPLGEIVFFRSAFALIPLIIFLWIRREFPHGLATKRPMDHLLRASFGALALFASFAAIARLNVAEAILIAQLSPILMAIAAVVLLREPLTPWRIGGLALGFAGVVVMVWPELGGENAGGTRLVGFMLGLLSAVLAALALIMVRSLTRTESPGAIALYFVLASMLGALATLPWGWVMPGGWTLVLLIGAGLFGGFAHIA